MLATALMHAPFAFALMWVAHGVAIGWRTIGAVGLAALLTALFRGRVALLFDDHPIGRLRRVLEEAYFIHWSALFFALPGFVLLGLAHALVGTLVSDASGIRWAGFASVCFDAAVSYGVGFVLAVWGVCLRRRWVRVRGLDIPMAGLGSAFDGYTVAQLSDLHIGSFCSRQRAEAWAARVNALDVDLVVLTGDYVTSGTAFHHDIAVALGQLRARDGVMAVMGNHDYFGDGEPLLSLLADEGIRMLRNERTTLRRGNQELVVAGVDDTYTKRCDIDRTFAGWQRDRPLVVLAHNPGLFGQLAERGAQLVLSGHTHWGQIGLPFAAERLNYARTVYRHHAGLYHEGDAALYVNPGLGTTGPPVRLGTWPEITVFTLRRA